jgi:DNA polymerase-1
MPRKSKNKKRIVLLDSHAILHRAYHALPDFSSAKGEPTGALYGLAAMLISIIKDLKPDYIVAAFDLAGPTYRHEAYADYKAGRRETDSDLVDQIKRAYDFYKAFNIPVYEKEGYEADDVLGTLAEELKTKGIAEKGDAEVFIASGDMDTLQLVDGNDVQVYTLKKGIKDTVIYNEKAVRERFGFDPELLTDYKGLRGDASDNIIGIAGIGEKTATDLITNFGTIENMYKVLKKSPEKFDKAGIKERIKKLLTENEEEAQFSKMLATIRRDVPIDFKIPTETWFEGVSADTIQELFRELSFRTLANRVREILPDGTDDETEESVKETAEGAEKLAQAKVAIWIINSDMTKPDLQDILNYTGEKNLNDAYEKLLEKIEKDGLDKVFNQIEKPLIPVIDQMEKNGIGIDQKFFTEISKEYHKDLSALEKKIWEITGEEFNINSSQQLAEVLFAKMELKYKGMRKTSTGKFSTKEEVLKKLCDSDEAGEKGREVAGLILEYREFQKLLSTYIDNIPKQVGGDGRLHANFLQTGTTTGRMSSNNPNLQNIPIGTERGRKIRHGFVADKGNVLVAFDYSQIELRIAAILSGDEKLLKIFKDGEDIHTAVAAEVFDVTPDKVDKEMRRQAKVINFGILYGMGVNALKDNLGSDRETAQDFYNKYFESYDGLAKYLDKVKADTARAGYTTTMFGRRRYFEGFKSPLPFIRAQAERMAINAPIQGSQADLIKLAMVKIDKYLRDEGLDKVDKKTGVSKVRLISQIHDEVIYEMPEAVAKKIQGDIKKIMEKTITSRETAGVPIIAECSIGPNWGNLKGVKNLGANL